MGGDTTPPTSCGRAVGAITTIDLDHVAYLGDTLGQIAFEKAGVIKPGMPVVVGRLPDEADAVVSRVAGEAHSYIVRAMEGVTASADMDGDGRTRLRLATPSSTTASFPSRCGACTRWRMPWSRRAWSKNSRAAVASRPPRLPSPPV